MKEFIFAEQILSNIFENNFTFKKALKDTFPSMNEDRKYLPLSSSLSGCELRHHILCSTLIENLKLELTNKEKNFLYLAISNIFFFKHFSKDDTIKFIKNQLKDKYNESIDHLLNFEGQIGDLLNIDRTSMEYISIRFNTPSWLIKMWNKHYGKSITFKVLKANCTPYRFEYRVDENKDVKLPDELTLGDVDNIYFCKGKGNLRNKSLFESGAIFPLKGAYKTLIDNNIDQFSNEYCLYSNNDDSLIKELFVLSKGEKGINVVVPDLSKRAEILRFIRVNKIKNINLFMGNDEIAYKTGISHPMDTIFVNAPSSSFDKIRLYPDYLLHFSKDELDQLIAKQKQILKDMSSFVSNDGKIVYMVDTLDKKETINIINSFLKENPEFELIDERQIYPFEKENITLYYAILHKKVQND